MFMVRKGSATVRVANWEEMAAYRRDTQQMGLMPGR
jgi:hypothetical protein